MTPEPALWKGRDRGPVSGGTSKKRRKKGSSSSGFCAPRSRMVPRVAMFTTAGETLRIIGASVGRPDSPVTGGIAAGSGVARTAANTHRAKARLMRPRILAPRGGAGRTQRRDCEAQRAGARPAPLPAPAPLGSRETVAGSARTLPAHRRSPSGGLNVDATRLLRRPLRNADLEHPVDVSRLDGFRIYTLGQREAAQERAGGALDALEAVLGRLLLRAALALDREHALLGRDLDVLALDARQVGSYHEALSLLVNVDVRDPADGRAVGGLAQGAIELPLQTAHERPGLVTNDGHAKHSC